MTPLVLELTAPALFIAGATTSVHCALMCGAINAAQLRAHGSVPLRRALLLVHGGRVAGYALLGALAGALGGRLALWLPAEAIGRALQALAALALVAAGLQQLTKRGQIHFSHGGCAATREKKMDLTPFSLLAHGLLWALVPCGILYTVLLLGALTTSAASGALLLGAFGLGTVPLMGISGGALALAARPADGRRLRQASGALLVALGLAAVLMVAIGPDALGHWLCAG